MEPDIALQEVGGDPSYRVIMARPRVSSACVVIPVINEGERILSLLRRMQALDIAGSADIVIVDGGSTDGSMEPARLAELGVAVLLRKLGPGKLGTQQRCAYHYVLDAGYQEIVTIDGNDKDDPDPIPSFIALVRGGVDFVQASRFLPGGVAENTPLKRMLAVRLIHAPLLSLASRFRWTDTTQGFRAYSRRLLTDPRIAPLRPEFTGYELLAYLNYRAPRLGFVCREVPTARRYPATGKIPTKIDLAGEARLLGILVKTCLGRYDA